MICMYTSICLDSAALYNKYLSLTECDAALLGT